MLTDICLRDWSKDSEICFCNWVCYMSNPHGSNLGVVCNGDQSSVPESRRFQKAKKNRTQALSPSALNFWKHKWDHSYKWAVNHFERMWWRTARWLSVVLQQEGPWFESLLSQDLFLCGVCVGFLWVLWGFLKDILTLWWTRCFPVCSLRASVQCSTSGLENEWME